MAGFAKVRRKFQWQFSGNLGSAELAAMCALAGRIVTVPEYMEQIKLVNAKAADVYRYMNFDQIKDFVEVAETVEM